MKRTRVTVYGMRSEGGPVAIGTGKTARGQMVTFACDDCYALDIAHAIADCVDVSELPMVELESWQILGVAPGLKLVKS